MFGAFVGAISIVLVVGSALCRYEYTLYTPEQKSQAPRLATAYHGSSVLLILVGLIGAVVVGSSVVSVLFPVVPVVGALPALIQHRMHRKLGIERSPLTEHTAENWL